MAQIGKVDEFKPENEPWTAYVERLEQFFDANDIDQGKNWLRELKLNWKLIKYVTATKPHTIQDLLDKYCDVFKDDLGTLKDITASIIVKPERIMENIMKDLPVVVYLDDLLITGRNKMEHNDNLEYVLQRLQENGLRVKRSKCEFDKEQIEYLGHVLDEHGIHPAKDKYRTTPNCTTGQSPADLFLHRHVRTRLDFLKPNTKETVRRLPFDSSTDYYGCD
uniref:ribonuclease H n=1 Tax=Knipowitschia caucasica TaxID=637954 RepID=A0AAV2L3W8_KNICA